MEYETPDDLGIYHEEYLKGAMGVIGGLLGEIQYELERLLNEDFKSIKNPDEHDAYKKGKEDARIKYEGLQSNYQKLRDQLEAFIREKGQASDNDTLNQAVLRLHRANLRIQQLEADFKRLQTETRINQAQANPLPQNLPILTNELTKLRRQNTELRGGIDASEKRLEEANARVVRFRRMIQVPSSKSHLDIFWVQGFDQIEVEVTEIIFRCLVLTERPKVIEGRRPNQRDRSLSNLWNMNLSQAELRNRVTAAIFEFLNAEILLKPAFDLDHIDDHVTIEPGLVAFEKRIEGLPQDNHGDITEWRRITSKCAQQIAKRGTGKKIDALFLDLRQFLEPLRGSKADIQLDQDYANRILQLCNDTFSLSQLMRAEPVTEFEIMIPAVGSVITQQENNQDMVASYAEEVGFAANLAGTIAYTRFGGLVKINKSIRIVLRKASVIVKGV
ncbi:hypothetical protein EYC80_003574 [Monilinia laxa]|uniref:Uncharacterized protein n=1 Tax=Monilinia laxa TaxID=61186 RepID=A0A5N6KKD9_MONLA|nr:hypothetical protein EYC80_003574 [Monilinia laxa]